jgi:3-phosphoshikimate 1-carboxyvinyltransferase
MSLPDLIEIMPLAQGPLEVNVTMPGSKSITNRALILAALAEGEVELTGALWSEDTQIMVDALRALGFRIDVNPDAAEASNRIIAVQGLGGRIPNTGTAEAPLEIFVGNAGTAARFLAAMVCLGDGSVRLHGVDRMHERPQKELFRALRRLGYHIDSPNDQLPAVFHGGGPCEASCTVSLNESSQFATALLQVAPRGKWYVDLAGANLDEAPYVRMTQEMMAAFPHGGGRFVIEPDASSGSFFWGINLFRETVEVSNWPMTGWQIDAQFTRFLSMPSEISRSKDLGDSIMTAIVLAPLTGRPVTFIDLGRLRVQECERVEALRTELTKCGVSVTEKGDTLHIEPGKLQGAEIETYRDHRLAMCFAVLGLSVPGMRLRDPACVRKTFPNFFQKLAAAPPEGVGAQIRDASGALLAGDDLLAA